MSLILNLETSTKNCSVSIAKNGVCLTSVEECSKEYFHSKKLHTFIEYAIKISGIHIKDLKSICVSKGPGSYTSLRIGASTARGLCYALDIPLLSIDTLTIMSYKINIKKGVLISMIHAKSNFFYTSVFNESKEKLNPIQIIKLNDNFFKSLFSKYKKIYFIIGNILSSIDIDKKIFFYVVKNRFLYKNPSAIDMSLISYKEFRKKKFNNIERFIPFYL
ncbi:tRNA (adenosine(37)-N6)-threonylcarbamoyltransferase complex dimerization subunit type 1 TsaB [Blattabacterium sp. (Blaberus giganteus)]|uniref:tRNA (adenosine(37)-N6)-threonylcarbamoyltransferase complex dimerization subunit type 1 TsaB n=1 Tax=Blattabacterium sp. (Blaberus giganteus) TaxID=1186051 RepID=UPI00025F6E39|nr:tRNA (adenosine(37)-N6)-threonylcarbamoyltransferase complex dimerization subunit type 1 TsaB [Blattabacterium sp. (Blaberus giganteus)]AFJ90523.1 peptidase M22, glycoprotease [Blattabacterium sp. (Blaberus giganteus)]